MSSTPAAPAAPAATLATTAAAPRIVIKFCTQCKWLLRAAYFAQELLSTFSTAIGEVALQPSTGGTFVVSIEHSDPAAAASVAPVAVVTTTVLWDRTVDGGFPETKELKRRVRDVIQPGRDLGHNDRVKKSDKTEAEEKTEMQTETDKTQAASCVSGECQS